MIDWNIRVGDLLVIVSLVGTAIVYAFKSGRFAGVIYSMQQEIKEMKEVAKAMSQVVTNMAVQNNRLDTAAERLNVMDKKIEDLRRGDGYIRGPKGVDREY